MIDVGSGPPVVLVPGIQGRWEWMQPAVEALSRRTRTVSYSLCGEPGTGCVLDHDAGFDAHVDQLDRVLDRARIDRMTLCGVSFGGWIAVRYAALRPSRVEALVLASAPGPSFRPDTRSQRYIRTPRLLFPFFLMTSRRALRPEVLSALPDRHERWVYTKTQLKRMALAPISPVLMGRRMRLAERMDFAADCARIAAPTLIVVGEEALDRVVPVRTTREYLALIRGSTLVTVPRTGHIGCITTPDAWADVVTSFAARARDVRTLQAAG